jgi:hypothetical protein
VTDVKSAPVEQRSPRTVRDDGDHDRFAHYVRQDDAMRGYVEGRPVRALCGKVWVPSRDPERYPLCPTCAELAAAILGQGPPAPS